jgi:uncharacterized membrane protein YqjE
MKEADLSQAVADGTDDVREITRILKTMSVDMVRLIGLEARLFGYTVLAMIGLTVMIALLLVGAWLFAGAALVAMLASFQVFNLMGALLTVALAHLLLAALAYWRLRHITRDLTFRESRASVNGLLNQAQSPLEAAMQGPQDQER